MKRILPNKIYRGRPCSVVALGCAMHITDPEALSALYSPVLKKDGYLSLKGMTALVRECTGSRRRWLFKRESRPSLRDFCHTFKGKAVVCVLGHYVYVEGGDYYSFQYNGDDPVVAVWVLSDKS